MDLSKLIKQGLLYPYRFVSGRKKAPTLDNFNIKSGEGAIVQIQGENVAVYKDGDKLIKLSPVCRHLGCIVGWNPKEKVWNCPCHGSRYSAEGKVINGPATKDLKKVS